MSDFDAFKKKSVDQIIGSLAQSYSKLRDEIHFVRLYEMEVALSKINNGAGALFEYDIDAYMIRCTCEKSSCHDFKIPFFLCPARYDGWADLTEISFALSKPLTAKERVAAHIFLLNAATREGCRCASEKEWRLISGECGERVGKIYAKLSPSRILTVGDVSGIKMERIENISNGVIAVVPLS